MDSHSAPQELNSNSTTKPPFNITTDPETTHTPPSTNDSETTDMSMTSGGGSNETTTISVTISSETTSSSPHIKQIYVPTLFVILSKLYF